MPQLDGVRFGHCLKHRPQCPRDRHSRVSVNFAFEAERRSVRDGYAFAHGPLDLPLDYRSPWWAALGDRVRAAGCFLSVYDPR
jgi:hypothetical protein